MLKEPIAIQRMTRTSDGAGGQTQSWATVSGAPIRAAVLPLSGSERYQFDRLDATASLKVTVRYVAGLLESDRIVIRNRNHNIRYIKNVEFADKWLELIVDAGVAT
jgi:SPP1 family predicted phage head-tail adaptor